MAVDAQIDKLSIDIETKINTQTDKIDKLSESLERLRRITEENWEKLGDISSKVNKFSTVNQASFSGFNSSMQEVASTISNLQQVTETPLQTEQGRLIKEFELVSSKISEVQNRYESLSETASLLGADFSQLTKEQRKLFLDLAYSGKTVEDIYAEQSSLTQGLINNYRKLDRITMKLQAEQSKLNQELDYAGKSAEKGSSAFDKLVLSIKRITFYRVVRRAIQLIGKEITTSIGNFAQFDEETNRAISGLQSSWRAFSNSIGAVASQLINTAAPLLIYVLDLATEIANTISLIFATISGEEYYKKAIKYQTDYAESIAKTNEQLLDFDKFNVLQKQAPETDISDMFALEEVSIGWANISEDAQLLLSGITALFAPAVISGLASLASGIFGVGVAMSFTAAMSATLRFAGIFLLVYAIIELITKWDELDHGMRALWITIASLGALIAIFSNMTIATTLVKAIMGANLSVGSLAATFGLLLLAMLAVAAAVYIFANWDDFSEGTKRAITIISTLILVLVTAAIAAMALMGSLTAGIAIPLIITGIAAGAVAIRGLVGGVKFFADGGVPDTRGGSMFVMNESGNPELIHENSKGQVQVSNQESLRGAFLDALRQHDAETRMAGQDDRIVVEFDVNGNALARALNPHLKQEAIRTGNR